jgi:peptidoglycan/LPS O-acetylase OafA/YrhL
VLSVFAVHSIPDALRGGFVGVDVFFVLSGYLIASITLREQASQGFSMLAFYRRRLRRLLPALLVVLMACLVFAAVWAIPADAKAIGKHVAAGAGFVSNLVLWREAGYFDPSSDLKPLLHLWSLGIEEQFYLFWPLLAWVLACAGRFSMPAVLLLLCLSFGLNVALVGPKPQAVFFLPFTRFWEILVGSLLAIWSHRVPGGPVLSAQACLRENSLLRQRMPDLFSAAGVVLLLAAVALTDKTVNFPGWWALLPTTGTFFLVAAGMASWVNQRVLALPVLTFYGRVSYPLYLWHWPLITIPALLDHPLDLLQQVGLLGLAVALAVLTHYGVEQPLRFGRLARRAPVLLLAGLLIVAGLGWSLYESDGRLADYPTLVRTIATEQIRQNREAIRLGTCFQTSAESRLAHAEDCTDQYPGAAPLLFLWGDSFAASLYPGLRELVDRRALATRLAQFTGPLCPPLLQGSPRQLAGCEAMNAIVMEQVRRLRPTIVALAASWSTYQPQEDGTLGELSGLQQTVAQLRGLGVERVVVVGTLPVWRAAQPRLLLSAWQLTGEVPYRLAGALVPHPLALDSLVADQALFAGAEFISVYDLLCNRNGCKTTRLRDGQLHAMAHDEAHLTTDGSIELARAMLPQLIHPAAQLKARP